MGPSLKPLATQRLLLVALLGVMAMSAWLLTFLRSGGERRGGAYERTVTAVSTELGAPREDEASRTAEPVTSSPAAERTVVPAVAPVTSAAVTAFDPGALTGRVLAQGEPVAGVEVRLYPAQLERRERTAPLAQTTTDEHGRFRVPGLAAHRRYATCLQHPRFAPSESALFPGHEEELELAPTATVRGRVRALSGAALAGVEIALERWHAAPDRFRALVASVSDVEGRWELPWARPGIERFLVLRAGQLPDTREFQVVLEHAGEYEIRLGSEEVLTLELFLLEDGTALADTDVLSEEARVRTDARGFLALPISQSALSEGSVRLALSLEGGPLTQGRIDLAAERRPGSVLRLPLARGGTVTGRVLDGNGGALEDAQVRLGGGGRLPAGLGFPEGFSLNAPRSGARSGSDGRFTLAGLAPREGPVQVRAEHPEHPSGRSEPFEFARLGSTVETEVRLETGASLEGVVRVDGEPASVRLYWNSERGGGWTRSNDRGAYRLRGLPAGELGLRPRLEEEDEDVPRAEDQSVFLEDGQDLVLDFALDGGRQWIRGRVVDSLGAPVAGADVLAMPSEDEAYAENGTEWMIEETSTESGPDGAFELAVPDQPGLVLDVWAQSGPAQAVAGSVRPGGPPLELVLPALATMALRVVDDLRHEPVQGFQLYWRLTDEGRFERLTQGGRRLSPGPDGTFEAELPLGRLDLVVTARAQGYAPALQEGIVVSATPAAPVEFALERGVELTLEIQAPPEAPTLLQQLVRARTALATEEQWSGRERDGDYFHQEVRNGQALRPGPDGTVRLAGLASGHYRFINVPKGLVLRPKTFELPPVASHRMSLTLEHKPEKPGQGQD